MASNDEPNSLDQPNAVPNQIHLVLTPDELAAIVRALHAIGANAFAQRLDMILHKIKPE